MGEGLDVEESPRDCLGWSWRPLTTICLAQETGEGCSGMGTREGGGCRAVDDMPFGFDATWESLAPSHQE